MGIVVLGAVFVDIKGYPETAFIPTGRNVGRVEQIHGGVGRNVAEDVANCELRPTFIGLVDQSGDRRGCNPQAQKPQGGTPIICVPPGMEWEPGWRFLTMMEMWRRRSPNGPNLLPIVDILKDHGDEIFRDADSVIMEIDVDKEIVKQTLHYAQKYGKKVYGVVANMSIALERRDFLQSVDCFVCNLLEAGILFSDNYEGKTADEMVEILARKVQAAQIPSMIVTMGGDGAVYADREGNKGFCPARQVKVKDTAGAGDAFCAGAAIGLTYGKSLREACEIGAHLAASVIVTSENVCPRFLPRELGLDLDVVD